MALKLIEDFFAVGANPENISGTVFQQDGGRVASSGALGPNGSAAWLALPTQGWSAPVNEVYTGFALRAAAAMTNAAIFSVYGDNNTTQHITLSMTAAQQLYIARGAPGTAIATSAIPFPLNQWRSINMWVTIHDSTGRVVVKVDGVTHIDFTGDTKNAGTNSTIDAIRCAIPNTANNGLTDLVVCDETGSINNTYPGDIAVIRRLPDGNGNYSQFTGSDGNQVNNFELVDEAPPNDADYVFAATAGLRDSYSVQDLPAATISVLGVRAVARTAKSGAGSAGMTVFVREGATDTDGPSVPLSTSFAWQGDTIRELCPSTSAAWTVSDVNGMEIGVKSESA